MQKPPCPEPKPCVFRQIKDIAKGNKGYRKATLGWHWQYLNAPPRI
jgi:hypothetical protein